MPSDLVAGRTTRCTRRTAASVGVARLHAARSLPLRGREPGRRRRRSRRRAVGHRPLPGAVHRISPRGTLTTYPLATSTRFRRRSCRARTARCGSRIRAPTPSAASRWTDRSPSTRCDLRRLRVRDRRRSRRRLWFTRPPATRSAGSRRRRVTEFPPPRPTRRPARRRRRRWRVWFGERNTNAITRITTAGVITPATRPGADADPRRSPRTARAASGSPALRGSAPADDARGRVRPARRTRHAPDWIAFDRSGDLWYAASSDARIGRADID